MVSSQVSSHVSDVLFEGVPARFEDFKRHIVEQVLNEVEHPLLQGARQRVVLVRASQTQLARLGAQPDAILKRRNALNSS